MTWKKQTKRLTRRVYDDDFKVEAVQMLLDGHSAQFVRASATTPTKRPPVPEDARKFRAFRQLEKHRTTQASCIGGGKDGSRIWL
jgi:hypothetical protein